MAVDLKPYIYVKGEDAALDAEFAQTKHYGKVSPGSTRIFWKLGLRRYAFPLEGVQRIFRRLLPVYGRLCCGGRSFMIEWLVLGYGLAAAVSAVFPNIVQGLSGVIIGALLLPVIRRVKGILKM